MWGSARGSPGRASGFMRLRNITGESQILRKRNAAETRYTTRVYGVRSRRTHLFGDQLWRADAGSWQIADRYTVASSAAHRIAVGDWRVHFVVEL